MIDEDETPEEKAERLGVPLIGTKQPRPVNPDQANPTYGVCPRCGLELKRVMHYSCADIDCPVFLKARF
jgi:hypothetical protein